MKKTDEIILWDYYLSYAQVFGFSQEILNTGYKKIIKNSSIEINNIDNIQFDSIDIVK